MVFPVVGGDGKPTGYEIDNSVRMGDGRRLSKTFTEVTAERKKHTISGWVKKCETGSEEHLILAYGDSNNYAYLRFHSDETLKFHIFGGGDADANIITNRLFRDPSAWYHVVLVYDSAQGTDSNRVKIYINGVQETSFSTASYPAQDFESSIGDNVAHYVCDSSDGDFYLSDWYYIGNQALSPSDFGETNDNGVWVPKKYEGSFGSTNDTFLEFKQTGTGTDASGIGADTSGEGNHFAVTNLAATDVTTDTPTNNFCTINSVFADSGNNLVLADFSEGNTKMLSTVDGWKFGRGTFLLTSGKWYVEVKATETGSGENGRFGIVPSEGGKVLGYGDDNDVFEGVTFALGGSDTNLEKLDTGTSSVIFSDLASGNTVMLAIDLDNDKIWLGKEGTWYNNNNASTTLSSSNHDIALPTVDHGWVFAFGIPRNGSNNITFEYNWGNPPNSISSGNADANGYGNFEFAVPSGFYSCCTKNLAEYG